MQLLQELDECEVKTVSVFVLVGDTPVGNKVLDIIVVLVVIGTGLLNTGPELGIEDTVGKLQANTTLLVW